MNFDRQRLRSCGDEIKNIWKAENENTHTFIGSIRSRLWWLMSVVKDAARPDGTTRRHDQAARDGKQFEREKRGSERTN